MSFTQPDGLHAAFAAAFHTHDVAALVDLYEDRAVQIGQDGVAVTGPDALANVFTHLLASGLTMQGDPQRAIVVGDLALTSTHYTFGADAPDGPTTVATAEVSRRQPDGNWRVVIDVPGFARTQARSDLDAGQALFLADGYERTSVDAVAARAGGA